MGQSDTGPSLALGSLFRLHAFQSTTTDEKGQCREGYDHSVEDDVCSPTHQPLRCLIITSALDFLHQVCVEMPSVHPSSASRSRSVSEGPVQPPVIDPSWRFGTQQNGHAVHRTGLGRSPSVTLASPRLCSVQYINASSR